MYSDARYMLYAIRRGVADVSITQMSNTINVSSAVISKLETGSIVPSLVHLERYANYIGIKVSDLIYALEDEDAPYHYLVKGGKEIRFNTQSRQVKRTLEAFNKLSDKEKQVVINKLKVVRINHDN